MGHGHTVSGRHSGSVAGDCISVLPETEGAVWVTVTGSVAGMVTQPLGGSSVPLETEGAVVHAGFSTALQVPFGLWLGSSASQYTPLNNIFTAKWYN